jgi:hypothetical protein
MRYRQLPETLDGPQQQSARAGDPARADSYVVSGTGTGTTSSPSMPLKSAGLHV